MAIVFGQPCAVLNLQFLEIQLARLESIGKVIRTLAESFYEDHGHIGLAIHLTLARVCAMDDLAQTLGLPVSVSVGVFITDMPVMHKFPFGSARDWVEIRHLKIWRFL